ncbi:MAG TPA: helicase, partial [Lachnospiraceae bacterium]|nr:helicase [Lachnospiraceae bacterium]
GSILFYDNCLYLPEKEFICNILPFYSSLFLGEEKSLEFGGENKSDFIEKVLPVIKKSIHVSVPMELKNSYIVEPLVPKLYLDIACSKTKCYISAVIQFAYGNYCVNPLHSFSSGKYILVRDKEEEERLTRLLYNLNFKVSEDCFLLKKEEDIFDLMTEHMELLTQNFEVFYSKAYKSASLQKTGFLSGKIRLESGIDFLEIDLDYSQIPKEELEEFFKAIRLKKRYYRLKNGAFINLQEQNSQLRTLSWMIENGQAEENGKIHLPKTAALFLEELLPKGNRIQKEEAYQKLIEQLHSPGKVKWEVPKTIQAKLRPYQKVGYQWLKTLAYYGMGGILADDMGLGKTLQAIVYICSSPGEKTLIVCPTSLAYNWQEEFEKFAPTAHTKIIAGTPEERCAAIKTSGAGDVLITTYPLIRKDIEYYRDITFDHFFIDEAQFIKNPGSLSAKAVKAVSAKHRFALTGTPIENALSELWSVFDFIMPGFFPRYSKFSELYEKPIMRGEDESMIQELK